ncbi:unnamed protein product [Auanema sp. JU1783]|nr:unnamed protein product [Auanema sp. JU1783]
MLRIVSSLLLLTAFVSANSVIPYFLHTDNEATVNECVEKVLEDLMQSTCLFFRQSSQEEARITILQSTNCAWQQDNNTVHLNEECMNEDVCFEIVGRALEVNQPRAHIVRHLNVNHNCTEKCLTECLHGGQIDEAADGSCSCKCPYGLKGERCEILDKQNVFTDTSCGIVDASKTESGQVSLSTYPEGRPKSTFCQWLITTSDPWSVIDAEVEKLGLDNIDVSPGMPCNDIMTVHGTENNEKQINCVDHNNQTLKFHSTGNTLFIELRSNPFSENTFTGPLITYRTRKVQTGVRTYSEGMSASSSTLIISSMLMVLFKYF